MKDLIGCSVGASTLAGPEVSLYRKSAAYLSMLCSSTCARSLIVAHRIAIQDALTMLW